MKIDAIQIFNSFPIDSRYGPKLMQSKSIRSKLSISKSIRSKFEHVGIDTVQIDRVGLIRSKLDVVGVHVVVTAAVCRRPLRGTVHTEAVLTLAKTPVCLAN